ncbi:hypothetical protein BJ973_000475 [Actinoplanes tereljensis]|uniref:Uncharacterized protein n=1 Tax=Paractinoplanes tereljensis TaxID=571912 RepID=A0A919NQE2_9ACTN|nr:hypothetical protein [Actinoplanes tereljensis]GIF23169.1 hypothetical protein Ate02nite_58990 [Actinoplanes tereljensis]
MKRSGPFGIIAGVLALALAALGAFAWVHARFTDTPAACAVPAAAPDKPRGPAAGGLKVVEQGFTNLNSGASFGAIVENTSTSVAYRTRVTFGFSNNGKPIEDIPSPLNTQEIPILRPGQRIGVGDTRVLAAPHSATAVEVRLGETTWLTPDEAGRGVLPVTTTDVRTEHPNADYSGYLKISYTTASPTCRPLAWRGVATVLRNQSGTIVGGVLDGSANGCATGPHVTSPGRLLPAADDTRTEVYPYCDLQRPAEDIANQLAN